MLNKETFATDPAQFNIANQGVAKVRLPIDDADLTVLRGELETFICDGHYEEGLARILDGFLGAGSGDAPAVWISGFYGSGKSHLAKVLGALWTNQTFPDGATAEGIIPHIPPSVKRGLVELRNAAKRAGGVVVGGDTLGNGPSDPAEATLQIILRAVGLPSDVRAALVALWLHDEDLLESMKKALGTTFDTDIANFILSPRFAPALHELRPDLAVDAKMLRSFLREQFPEPPPVTVDLLETMAKRALLVGRKEMPLTLIVLDEVQQFIRQDPSLTLTIQNIAEQLSSRFGGRLLLVATGQQALSNQLHLQKLMGRFKVQVSLSAADINSVIRKTILRKKPDALKPLRAMLDANAGEISRQLSGTKIGHKVEDDEDAALDWPLLPSRRRLWAEIMRALDPTRLGSTLRNQLSSTLDAARAYADRPRGHAVPADVLYGQVASEASNIGLLQAETKARIDTLLAGSEDDKLKARVLSLVYMLSQIAPDADQHGVRAQADMIADLMVVDLAGEPTLRPRVQAALTALADDGAILEVAGAWRIQTKESADWEKAFKDAERNELADTAAMSRDRRDLLARALDDALAGVSNIAQGQAKESRRIHRLTPDEREPADGVPLRLHNGWEEPLETVERAVAAAPPTDPAVHVLVPVAEPNELSRALAAKRAADHVLQVRGVPSTDAGREARQSMETRRQRGEDDARNIIREAVRKARVYQAGGALVTGALADAVKAAAANSIVRRYPDFGVADHPGWGKVYERAQRKDPDAMKAVDHSAPPETHPVARALLAELGSGKKGSDLRRKFDEPGYGWPKDAVDGMLVALANAGLLRVTGEDGKPASLPDLPRTKISSCTFRNETTVVTITHRLAVRGLLNEVGLTFANNQENLALSGLMERLEHMAKASGGDAPAPAPQLVPDLAALRSVSDNDLLVKLADAAPSLKAAIVEWRGAATLLSDRQSAWNLAERLVSLGATEQAADLEAIRMARSLLANPDPTPPIVQAAAVALRDKLNALWTAWQAAWTAGEARLNDDATWARLTPEQKHDLRVQAGLLKADAPTVETPDSIAASLAKHGLGQWDSDIKALPQRVAEALAEAAALLEPKARAVHLQSGLIKTTSELEVWLAQTRERLEKGLAEGPVIPKV